MNRKRTVIAGFCLCVLVAGIACALGMRVQPGGALIQGWPIGEKRELPTPLVIFNDDDAPRTMTVAAMKPSALGAGPIRGYAELPDTSWMSFQPAEVAVPPNGRAAVRMFLSVPPDERYLNQHWSVNLARPTPPLTGASSSRRGRFGSSFCAPAGTRGPPCCASGTTGRLSARAASPYTVVRKRASAPSSPFRAARAGFPTRVGFSRRSNRASYRRENSRTSGFVAQFRPARGTRAELGRPSSSRKPGRR